MQIKTIASSSAGNCYLVSSRDSSLMIECGIPIAKIKKAMDFDLSAVAGCLCTHEHADHSKAAKDLMRAGVDCYMSAGTAGEIGAAGHRLKTIVANIQVKIGPWTVLPFGAVHDAAEPLSFLVANGDENLLFATDTAYIKHRCPGLNYIMVECNYTMERLNENIAAGAVPECTKPRLLRSHMNLDNVLDMLRANDLSRVREIHLMHLSSRNSDAARMKREVAALTGIQTFICGE